MSPKDKNTIPSSGINACITTMIWLLAISRNDNCFFVDASEDDPAPIRWEEDHANITTAVTNYNHCNTKCVTSIATGYRRGCQGFAGEDCSFPYEICPDNITQCFGPSAVCIDSADDRRVRNGVSRVGYRCDCRVAFSIEHTTVMRDAMIQDCHDRITEVCEKDQNISLYSFCTNGGQCVDKVEPGEPHPGCFCPGRFVGRHCEKRRGTGSDYRINPTEVKVDGLNEIIEEKSNKRGLRLWINILVAFLSLLMAGFLIYGAVLYKRFRSSRNTPLASRDGNIKGKMTMIPACDSNDNMSALEMD